MGCGASTEAAPRSEWLAHWNDPGSLALVQKGVTQTFRDKGTYRGESGREILKRPRLEVQVFLEDRGDFAERYSSALTLSRPGYVGAVDLRPFVAYQVARLLWLAAAAEDHVAGRFLVGFRDPHYLRPREGEDIDLRIDVLGDRETHRILLADPAKLEALGPKCFFAEAVSTSTPFKAQPPAVEFVDQGGHVLHRVPRYESLPGAPEPSAFQGKHLSSLIRQYYEQLRSSVLGRRLAALATAARKPSAALPAPLPPEPPKPEPVLELALTEAVGEDDVTLWPADSDPRALQATALKWNFPPFRGAGEDGGGAGQSLMMAPLAAVGGGGYSPSHYAPADWRQAAAAVGPPQRAAAPLVGPLYQMYLPSQYPA